MNFYRDSKAISIEKAKNLAFKEQFNLTVIHPVFVYGEREFSSGFYEYLKSVSSGIKIFPGSLKNKFHTIYARNLAKIYHLAYKKVLKGVNEFIAGDKTAEYQHVIYEKFCEYAGFKPPFLMPKEILYIPGFLMELIYTMLRTEKPPVLTRARVNMFYDNIEYSTVKLIKEFDYTPDYDLDEGIERTVKWYKANNYL